MPKLYPSPLHRIHIMLEEDDVKWLKKTYGTEGQISEVIRKQIKRLRGVAQSNPGKSLKEIMSREDW